VIERFFSPNLREKKKGQKVTLGLTGNRTPVEREKKPRNKERDQEGKSQQVSRKIRSGERGGHAFTHTIKKNKIRNPGEKGSGKKGGVPRIFDRKQKHTGFSSEK